MRSFSFHAKTIGKERYLTYIMGEGMELDEDTLDFMEDEMPEDLVRVIFEQDEDYDYLTYDISGKVSLQKYTSGVMNKETVLKILRNVALGMINCKEQALHLAYILLHKEVKSLLWFGVFLCLRRKSIHPLFFQNLYRYY